MRKSLLLTIQTFINPKYLCCNLKRKTTKQHLRVKGYKHMLKEMSIVNILKQLRVLKGAIKYEKSIQEWKNLKLSYAMMAYSDLESENEDQSKAESSSGE